MVLLEARARLRVRFLMVTFCTCRCSSPMLRARMLPSPILHEGTRKVMPEPSTPLTFFDIERMHSRVTFLRLYACSYHRHVMERARCISRVLEFKGLLRVINEQSAKCRSTGSRIDDIRRLLPHTRSGHQIGVVQVIPNSVLPSPI